MLTQVQLRRDANARLRVQPSKDALKFSKRVWWVTSREHEGKLCWLMKLRESDELVQAFNTRDHAAHPAPWACHEDDLDFAWWLQYSEVPDPPNPSCART